MAKTITFKKDQDKERIDTLLSDTRMRECMPENIRGKCAPMTLWAIEHLSRFIERNVNAEKIQVITLENQKLKARVQQLEEQVKEQSEATASKLEIVRKAIEWTRNQINNTPEYADELLDNLFSEIAE